MIETYGLRGPSSPARELESLLGEPEISPMWVSSFSLAFYLCVGQR